MTKENPGIGKFMLKFIILSLLLTTPIFGFTIVQPAIYIQFDDGTCKLQVFSGEDADSHLFEIKEINHSKDCECLK